MIQDLATATNVPSIPPRAPWRDLHTVSPERLADFIAELEEACLSHPESADLRTCIGIAHAMNYEVYKSMDALEEALRIDPGSFWARFKYAELHYRLRALPKAEEETLAALELADNGWELSLGRKQLLEIRRLMREGACKPAWTKPFGKSALVCLAMFVLLCLGMAWK